MEGMERSLLSILSDFRKSTKGVSGIVLSTYDGLPIVCEPRDGAEFLCAAAATVYSAGINIGERLGMNGFRSATVETDKGIFLVSGFDGLALLISIASRDFLQEVSKRIPALMVKLKTSLWAE
jgi:predicted regulator of Ras-like GTPase activity (Roadblock/LC7/MglB family)